MVLIKEGKLFDMVEGEVRKGLGLWLRGHVLVIGEVSGCVDM